MKHAFARRTFLTSALVIASLAVMNCSQAQGSLRVRGNVVSQSLEALPLAEGTEAAVLWLVFDPEQPYVAQSVAVSGALPAAFAIDLAAEPTADASYPLIIPNDDEEAPEVPYDPADLRVGIAQIVLTAPGMLENEPDGVVALDPDKVLGMANAYLVWSSRNVSGAELGSAANVIGIDANTALSAGYSIVRIDPETHVSTSIEVLGASDLEIILGNLFT